MNIKTKRTKSLSLLSSLLFASVMLFLFAAPIVNEMGDNSETDTNTITDDIGLTEQDHIPKSAATYEWWNGSWELRFPVTLSPNGANQTNVPIELFVNFTAYLEDLNLEEFELDEESIRVIEYTSITETVEIASEFHPYTIASGYDALTNAIGDMVWIANGTTEDDEQRNYFVYLNHNESSVEVPDANYPGTIREKHYGFEEDVTILSAAGTSQDRTPDLYQTNSTNAARGDYALRIYGNCWKAINLGSTKTVTSTTYMTVKMRIDDPDIERDVTGIGFQQSGNLASLPATTDTYQMRGWQDGMTNPWGDAIAPEPYGPYHNKYYAEETYFWYTLDLNNEIASNDFQYIFLVADYDYYQGNDIYWDDISLWDTEVQTDPDNMPVITTGDVEAVSYSLKVICKDRDGFLVPDVNVSLTVDGKPSLAQDFLSTEEGIALFNEIESTESYDITAYYTQNGVTDPETRVVNVTQDYQVENLTNTITLDLDLWTINFSVQDVDGDPIQYGYVQLENNSDIVGKFSFDEIGNATAIWLDTTEYNYSIYFDYTMVPEEISQKPEKLLLYDSTIGGENYIEVQTNISKIHFYVIDQNDDKFENAILRVYNSSTYDGDVSKVIANLTVADTGFVNFYAFNNFTDEYGNYSVEVYFAGLRRGFNTTIVNPEYDLFVLESEMNVGLKVQLDKSNYNTKIEEISRTPTNFQTDVFWNDEIIIRLNFTTNDTSGTPNVNSVDPDELYFQILGSELSDLTPKYSYKGLYSSMFTKIDDGIFDFTLNTSDFGLTGGQFYFIEFTGTQSGFTDPEPYRIQFESKEINTDLSAYDYYTLAEYSGLEATQYWNEKINITIGYFLDGDDSALLEGASLSYEWDFGSGSINQDSAKVNGYYTFEIDTGLSPNIGKYRIDITASLLNHSTEELLFDINIISRTTLLDGKADDVIYYSRDFYVGDSVNYTFEYNDSLSIANSRISSADDASYTLQRLDNDGTPIIGQTREGDLIETSETLYVLDLDTELLEVGNYFIFLTFEKDNYDAKDLVLDLEIKERTIDTDLTATNLEDDIISVVQGNQVEMELKLTDPTQSDMKLTGAKVVLIINEQEFEFEETDEGVFTYTFETDEYEALITSQTITGQLEISKANYTTATVDITIVIELEEIFPGIPTFYFFMIVGAIAAVGGSLIAYRAVQMAKIPKFVKNARAMKDAVQSKKKISESLLYPSKNEHIVKLLGDKWEELGLSLAAIMGLEAKEGKQTSKLKSERINKENGGS